MENMETGLKAMELDANNNQKGTAASLLAMLRIGTNKPKKIVASVPTGKGKSRIIASLVSVALLTRFADKIVVVFPSYILLKTDKDVLERVTTLCKSQGASLVCVVGLRGMKYDKETLYIVDECDYEVLDQTNYIPSSFNEMKGMLGLTASSAANEMDKVELTNKGWKVIDPKIKNTVDPAHVETCSFEEFLTKHPDRAKLIFISNEEVNSYQEQAKQHGLDCIVNCSDLEIIRKLAKHHCLVVTDELLMRGVDYRSKQGIDLFIGRTAMNERSYLQCLGRVARCTDVGDRFIKPGLLRFKKTWESITILSDQPNLKNNDK